MPNYDVGEKPCDALSSKLAQIARDEPNMGFGIGDVFVVVAKEMRK